MASWSAIIAESCSPTFPVQSATSVTHKILSQGFNTSPATKFLGGKAIPSTWCGKTELHTVDKWMWTNEKLNKYMMENLAANEVSNQANTLVPINKIQVHTHGEKTYDLCTSIVATKAAPGDELLQFANRWTLLQPWPGANVHQPSQLPTSLSKKVLTKNIKLTKIIVFLTVRRGARCHFQTSACFMQTKAGRLGGPFQSDLQRPGMKNWPLLSICKCETYKKQ